MVIRLARHADNATATDAAAAAGIAAAAAWQGAPSRGLMHRMTPAARRAEPSRATRQGKIIAERNVT